MSETPTAEKDAGIEFAGLTHQCSDPDCHVAGFVATLKLVDSPPSTGADGAEKAVLCPGCLKQGSRCDLASGLIACLESCVVCENALAAPMPVAERVRAVLDTYWTMTLEGQAPGDDWLYRRVRECVTSPGVRPDR